MKFSVLILTTIFKQCSPLSLNSFVSATPVVRSADELWALHSNEGSSIRERADALCGWMRLMTDGNTVTIDGPGDGPAFRSIWKEHAPRAVDMYRGLLTQNPNDPDLLCNFIECFSAQSASKGIALAALTGDAVVFLGNVGKLRDSHGAHCNGLAHIFFAAFYLAAPFPVRSNRRAMSSALLALEVAPLSRRNNYYAGLAALASNENLKAVAYFEKSLDPRATKTSQSELDIDAVLIREAERGLAIATTKV